MPFGLPWVGGGVGGGSSSKNLLSTEPESDAESFSIEEHTWGTCRREGNPDRVGKSRAMTS